ncbi:hypothetical protein [Deinococcus aquaticus]|uniref:hypothetical protein n=1 Tax=Deinococcus aquaticus TaxID=328692 RepID=UPI003F473684
MKAPASLLTLSAGQPVWYLPTRMDRPHAGERGTVTRAPRPDVQTPTVRLTFGNGDALTVPIKHVSAYQPSTDASLLVDEARRLPSWKRLIHLSQYPQFQAEVEQRARQLAGMVTPRTGSAAKIDVARMILEAAQAEAVTSQTRTPGRAGRGQPTPTHQPVPTDDLSNFRLDQEGRAMVNNIARCIHRRYFLSDAELRDLSDAEREQEQIHGTLRTFIRRAQGEAGLLPIKDTGGKGSALHGQLHDSLTHAYPLALEACQMLLAGKDDHALTLALRVREHLLTHVAANSELDRARRKHHTGRYFHGDVLSVREIHEDGRMTQYYARLTIIYAEDGHSLVVANAAELEALTGTRAGVQAWNSLCRWIEDLSERAGGRKQGRRQDDDEHLIYRDDDGHLRLRAALDRYPNLLRAFECVRRALMVPARRTDILAAEIHRALPRVVSSPQTRTT